MQRNVLPIYRKSVTFGQNYFFCEEQTLYGSARLGTEQVEHSMRGLVSNDALTDEITRAREQHGEHWQERLNEQYEGRFYERLQEAWGTEWNTRLDFVLQGNNDGWLVEQIRNESYTLQAGNKRFELSNHLGNVLAVVSDKKVQTDGVVWQAEVVSAQDYFPFGMAMPGRSSGSYRYGVTGKERDDETQTYDFGARFYRSNIGRWLSPDPLERKYPGWSTYNYCMGNSIIFIDPDGKSPEWTPDVKVSSITTKPYYYRKDTKGDYTLIPGGKKLEVKIILRMEQNDDLNTLKTYLKGSKLETQVEQLWARRKHQGGTHVELPEDNYSDAFLYAQKHPKEFSTKQQWNDPKNYNCYHYAFNGVEQTPIYRTQKDYPFIMEAEPTQEKLVKSFTEVKPNQAIFGKTIIAANYSGELPMHLMVYAGRDHQGNIYVMHKYGRSEPPRIQKMSDMSSTGDARFFNPKPN